MSHSIRKSLAAAALILGCSVVSRCLPADAGEFPFVIQAGGGISPIGSDPDEIWVPNAVPGPPPLRHPSEKERQIFKRIRAAWQARHERIRSFSIAWDSPPDPRRNPYAGPLARHTELCVDQGLRFRFLTSSPPNTLPYQETFDGMTYCSWNSETDRGEVWNGEPKKGRAYGDTLIWRIGVDPLSMDLVDISSPDFNVLSEDEIIGGRHCVKLRFPIKGDDLLRGWFDILWMDPSRDDIIVRWEQGIPDTPSMFMSIDYAPDKTLGWLPSRCTYSDASTTAEAETATKIAINERYPIAMFRQTFPPGTQVGDQRLSQRYVIGPDGSKTHVKKRVYRVKQESIYDSLNRTTDFVINPEPLKDALAFIGQRYHIKTAFDDPAVRQGLIDLAVQVQTEKHGIKLKELLDLLLKQSPKPLRYEIHNDVVTVIADPASRGSSK
jgi:hypothetical protein